MDFGPLQVAAALDDAKGVGVRLWRAEWIKLGRTARGNWVEHGGPGVEKVAKGNAVSGRGSC